MVLSGSAYFIFLAGVFFLYWPLSRWRAAGLAVILFANYFFYAKWDLFYLGLIPACSLADYLLARGMGASRRPLVRRALVLASLLLNLGVLASFKYMTFLLENYAALTGQPAPAWHWSFPLGISFYCFQSLTYTIDVYRRDAPPARSVLAYLSAVSFFPTTLAGPITRPAALMPQLENTARALDTGESGRALFLIALGLIKKLLIADYLADNLVNRVFDLPKLYAATEVAAGAYGYALQLYYDFSGYTDVAIGSALLLGLKLPANFRRPYAAANIADFWRRWHITLSNWLRDYLYFSLPGLRAKSKIFTSVNLLVTMTLGGLWHGASWNFVLWGALHGAALAVQRAWRTWRGEGPASRSGKLAAALLTVHFVVLAWIPFRAPDLATARSILEQLGSATVSFANISPGVALVMAIAAVAHYLPAGWYEWSQRQYARIPFYAQAATLLLLAMALRYVAGTGAAPFIYTQF
jgi:alginate O-acetyltransferase complex protein AlgI